MKTQDKQFIKWKDISKYKDKYLTMLTIPRRQKCFICYVEAEKRLKEIENEK